MISAKPTTNLTGITLEGTFEDFYEIVKSIHRMTGPDDGYNDRYWSVKNRLLGICYDVRHAYMGDRDIKLVDTRVDEYLMERHSMIMPVTEVHVSENFLFPEAIFVAFSASELYIPATIHYGQKTKKKTEETLFLQERYSDYIRDKAVIDILSAVFLGALADVIGEEEFEKLMQLKNRQFVQNYAGYATQYVDKCNIEYLKTPVEKRKDKIRNIAKRFAKHPDSYLNMKRDIEYAAKQYQCSVHNIHDPRMEYPEEIEW